jgi:hypothetical protein
VRDVHLTNLRFDQAANQPLIENTNGVTTRRVLVNGAPPAGGRRHGGRRHGGVNEMPGPGVAWGR